MVFVRNAFPLTTKGYNNALSGTRVATKEKNVQKMTAHLRPIANGSGTCSKVATDLIYRLQTGENSQIREPFQRDVDALCCAIRTSDTECSSLLRREVLEQFPKSYQDTCTATRPTDEVCAQLLK